MPWLECVDCCIEYWVDDGEEWKIRCKRCWLIHMGIAQANQQSQTLNKQVRAAQTLLAFFFDNLKFMLMACHPDKHGPANQQRAEEVTRWLIEFKETNHALGKSGSGNPPATG